MDLFRWIKRTGHLLFPKKLDRYMSFGLKVKSFKTHDNSVKKFIERHNREPSRYELGRIIINDSHKAVTRRGKKAHWRRQKIRRMLFEDNHIKYKPR